MPEFHSVYTQDITQTVGFVCCNGPIGLPLVMPVMIGVSGGSIYATSLCNGSTMHNLWLLQNNLIATISHGSSTLPSYASWIYVPQPASSVTNITLPGTLFTPPKPRPRMVSKAIYAGRRAVRRSINIYARFRGIDEVRRFLRGDEIVYHGRSYDYRIRKTVQLVPQAMRPDSNHIPYGLRATEKTTGRHLAKGCVIFPALPVFDQLLALSFHAGDPIEEQKLLRITNWTPHLPQRLLREAA